MQTRRNFVKLSAMGALAGASNLTFANSVFNFNPSPESDLKVFLFSKHLQFLNYNDMSEAAKEMGFDGLDLTVRKKGHVLPENVSEDLPKATEAMKSFGLQPLMMATNVSDASNATDKKVLEVASQLGYKYYRPSWYKYKKGEDVKAILETSTEKIKGLAELNQQLNISGSYHNHSGSYMGAPVWDLAQALDGISPQYFGCQYDVMHGSIEGGKAWEVNFERIRPHINTLVVKDYVWKKVDGKWKVEYTPMGEGMVDFKRYFSLLKKYKINVPMSIHVEYDLGGAEHGAVPTTMDKTEVLKKIKKDLEFVRKMWSDAI